MASRNDPRPVHHMPEPEYTPPAPTFARLLLTFAVGVWLLGAGFGLAAWVGYRTFRSLDNLFPVP